MSTLSDSDKNKWLTQGLAFLLLSGILFVVYLFFFLGPLQDFSYQPAYQIELNTDKIVFGCLIIMITAFFLPRDQRPSSWFLVFIYAFVIIPRLVIWGCRDLNNLYPLCCLIVFIALLGVHTRIRQNEIKIPEKNQKIFLRFGRLLMTGFFLIAILVCVLMVLFEGLPTFQAFDFSLTYEIRGDLNLPVFLSALLSFVGTFMLPMMLCVYVSRGDKTKILVVVLLELLLFMWTANKSWLYIIVLILVLAFIRHKELFSIVKLYFAITLAFAVLLLFQLFCANETTDWLFTQFIRRLIFVPSVLGYEYFIFFLDNPWILFNGTLLAPLTPMPSAYEIIDYQNHIAFQAFGSLDSWANTGLFGGEFANFGPYSFGLIFINLFLVIVLLNRYPAGNKDFTWLSALFFTFTLLNVSSIRLIESPTGLLIMAAYILIVVSSAALTSEANVEISEVKTQQYKD